MHNNSLTILNIAHTRGVCLLNGGLRKTLLKMVVERIYQGQEGIQREQVITVFFYTGLRSGS